MTVIDATRAEIELLDGPRSLALSTELHAVYRRAFGAPPYAAADPKDSEADAELWRDDSLPKHATRAGFRCAVARADGAVVGFGYGYTGRRGQFWTDHVAARVSPELADRWLDGHFELVELAVEPASQGRGTGGALHDTLLTGLPHDRALLGTWRVDSPARRLYLHRGWQLLVDDLDGQSSLLGRLLRPSP